jgi:signal transduction histidine kinase
MKLDKDKMGQVFTNLLSNALKYTPDSGMIRVSVKPVDRAAAAAVGGPSGAAASANGEGFVRIDVADSGVGIPPEDVGKLFGKFFQAKNVPHVKEKGSGLGLALVKHVTEAHGGRVSVESEVGTGSTFSVFLPRN